MLNRRQFLSRTMKASSLLAFGGVVPQFLASTGRAAEAGKETILVVIEMTGGNDGLNMVIPYADDLYHKARPTLRHTKDQVVKVDDHIGLNSGMASLRQLIDNGQLAVVQGVGYPNPDRSHFESMDIWQSAEVGRKLSGTGWLARSVPDLNGNKGGIPAMQVGPEILPLALQGAPQGVMSLNNQQTYSLNLGDAVAPQNRFAPVKVADVPQPPKASDSPEDERRKKRLRMLQDLTQGDDKDGLLPFVRRRQLQTYTTLEKLREVIQDQENVRGNWNGAGNLYQKLQLINSMIARDFGARIYYVSQDGYDTHSGQAEPHRKLLEELANGVTNFFGSLGANNQRVVVMTFSEFGRRVQENGSKGTDHGAGSCMLVAGPAVKGGATTQHPSLSDLDSGDLKYHTDFRRVYATLLDQWLGVDSNGVLGARFEHLPLLKAKG